MLKVKVTNGDEILLFLHIRCPSPYVFVFKLLLTKLYFLMSEGYRPLIFYVGHEYNSVLNISVVLLQQVFIRVVTGVTDMWERAVYMSRVWLCSVREGFRNSSSAN